MTRPFSRPVPFRSLHALRFSLTTLAALSGAAAFAQAQKTPAVPTKTVSPPGTQKLGTAQVKPTPSPSYVLYNDALRLTDAGFKAEQAGDKKAAHAKYEAARVKYRKILEIEGAAGQKPGTVTAGGTAAIWANMALLSARENKPDTVTLMKKATVLSPKTGAFWQQLGALSLQSHDWAGSAKAARQALVLLPNDDTAQATLSIALMQQNKFAEALPLLRKKKLLRNEKPPQGEVRLLYGLMGANKKDEALALAQKLTKEYPKDARVQQLSGDVAMRMGGSSSEANTAFRKAYTLNPNLVSGLKASIAAQSAGKYDEARKIASRLIVQFPSDARPHFQLGYLSFYAPDSLDTPGAPTHYQQAEKEFRSAALIEPKNASYVGFWGLSMLLQGPERAADAGQLLRMATKLDPAAPLPRLGLAKIAEQKNDWDEAEKQYQGVIDTAKEKEYISRARAGLSGVLYTAGKKEAAYVQLEKIANETPTDINALAQLASWQVRDGVLPQAEATYLKIIARSDKNPAANSDARVAVGQLMEKTDRPTEAIGQYKQALVVNPHSASAALALGNLYLERKQENDAVKVYQDVLKNADDKAQLAQNNMVRWQLASVYETNLKKPDEALAQMQAMLIRPDDPNRLVYMLGPARLMLGQKHYDAAIQNLTRLRTENPQDKGIQYVLADAYEKNNKPIEAEAILRNLASPPGTLGAATPPAQTVETLSAHLALGGLYERENKWAEAANEYETVLHVDTGQNDAVFGLARAREAQKKPELVTSFFDELVFASPTEPNVAAVYAAQKAFQQQSGKPAGPSYQALTNKLVTKYPKDKNALGARIQVLMAAESRTSGERTEAEGLLKRLLEQIPPRPAQASANVQLGKLAEENNQKTEAIGYYTRAAQLDAQNNTATAALSRLKAPFPAPLPTPAPTPAPMTAAAENPPAPSPVTIPASAPPRTGSVPPGTGGSPFVPRANPAPKP